VRCKQMQKKGGDDLLCSTNLSKLTEVHFNWLFHNIFKARSVNGAELLTSSHVIYNFLLYPVCVCLCGKRCLLTAKNEHFAHKIFKKNQCRTNKAEKGNVTAPWCCMSPNNPHEPGSTESINLKGSWDEVVFFIAGDCVAVSTSSKIFYCLLRPVLHKNRYIHICIGGRLTS
jgi:hypothetical protein